MKSVLIYFLLLSGLALQGQTVESLIKEGRTLFQEKNYSAAIEKYSQALQLAPNNKAALNNRADAFLQLNENDLAIADCNAVLQVDGKNVYAYNNRGWAFRRKKMFNEAMLDFNTALSINPANEWTLQTRGLLLHEMKLYDLAIADFTELIRLNPKKTRVYTDRAISYFQIKDYDAALEDLTKAIELDKNYALAYSWRGFTFAKLNQLALAIDDYSSAIALEPEVTNNYNNRGLYYTQVGNYELAVQDLKKVISLNEKLGNPYISIIPPLVRLGQWEEAYGYYKQYKSRGLRSYAENDNFTFLKYYFDALKLAVEGKYPEASDALALASDKYGNELKTETQRWYVDMMFLEGKMLEKQGYVEEAKVMYEQALTISPGQPDLEAILANMEKAAANALSSDKTAPEISIITPANNQTAGAENSTVQIVGRAKDVAGIAYVKLNGTNVEKLEEDGLFITSTTLSSGTNKWEITAADKKGNIATYGMEVSAAAAMRGTAPVGMGDGKTNIVIESKPTFHAILIAAQEYEDPKFDDLKNPKRDAIELGEILKKYYSFKPENIDTLFDRSREDVMAAIVKKSSALTENESLVIFYAGHGYAEKDKFGDYDGYWVPSSARSGLNASYISTEDINKAIKRTNARHVLIIADACFSGAMTRSLPSDAAKEVTRQYIYPSRKVMASGSIEPVPDNSKFIFFLKKRLVDNNEKYLTAKDLYDSFYKAVLGAGTRPQYAAIKNIGDEGGEFVFIKE